MKQSVLVRLFLIFSLSFSTFATKKGLVVDVNLSPAGSFQIKGKIKGSVYEEGGKLKSKNLYSPVKRFKTGMDLRDNHTKKKLQYKKFPKVEILKAIGSDGKGKAVIKIRSIKKAISFKYKRVSAKYVKAVFKLSLKDFKFVGVNYMGVGVKDKVKITAVIPVKK